MKEFEEAFKDYDVKLEEHKGDINKFICDNSIICPNYSKGDIVFVKKEAKTSNDNHLFLLIDEQYNSKLITSTSGKILIKKDNTNNLLCDSYLTEQIYKLDPSKILFKIGNINI